MNPIPPAGIDHGMTRTGTRTRPLPGAPEEEKAAQLAVGIRERSDGERLPGLVEIEQSHRVVLELHLPSF